MVTLAAIHSAPLGAQPPAFEDLFEAPDDGAAAAPVVPQPPVAPPAAPADAPAEEPSPPELTPEEQQAAALAAELEDRAVAVVVSLPAETPEQMLDRLMTLLDLRAPAHARQMFDRLVQAQLTDAQKAQLANRFGSGEILRLARQAQPLGEDAVQWAHSLIEAAASAARDPARLAEHVAALASDDAVVRAAAARNLLQAQTAGATYLIGVLADPQQAEVHPAVRAILLRMGPAALGPLLGVMETANPQLLAEVVALLGRLDSRKAIPLLYGPATIGATGPVRDAARQALVRLTGGAPNAEQAEAALLATIRQALSGIHPYVADHRGLVTLWQWNDAQRTATPVELPQQDVGRVLAQRLAEDLVAMRPDYAPNRHLHAALWLEIAKMSAGYGTPLPRAPGGAFAHVAAMGPDEASLVLAAALYRGLVGGAIGASEVLQQIGTAGVLGQDTGEPSPLARALAHGSSHLKFAALAAIMQIAPTQPYPGAGFVPETLTFLASHSGAPQAVVAHPRVEKAQRIAALLEQVGYHTHVATSGQQAVELATGSADVQFVLIDMAVSRPLPRDVVFAIRHGRRTSRLPIGVVQSLETPEDALRLADDDPLTVPLVRPHEPETAADMAADLVALTGRIAVTTEQRQRQAAQALDWMATLLQSPAAPYDLREEIRRVYELVHVPGLRRHAINVLAHANAAAAQRVLVDLASDLLVDVDDRRLAATAFRVNVYQHGTLLTRAELLRQYDRYNASATADEATQDVLGSVLDTLEARMQASATP